MRPSFLLLSDAGSHALSAPIAERVRAVLPEMRSSGRDTLFTSSGCPLIDMPEIGGWLIGSLYDRTGRHRHSAIDPSGQLSILSSDGRLLIDRHSGAYVALWRGHGPAPLVAMRDPSACLPGYWACSEGRIVIATDIELLALAGLTGLALDPAGIAQYLRFPLIPTAKTALRGIGELRPGFRTRFAETMETEARWRPMDFSGSNPIAAGDLARTISDVVCGQCADPGHAAVELSGGLDSSIVAAALGREDRASALHIVPATQDGDERRYASAVIERLGMTMVEVPVGFEDVDMFAKPARLTPRPTGVEHFRAIDRKMRLAQLAAGATSVFSGAGGDSVFCSLASTGPIVDAWHSGGIAAARLTLADIATINEVTRWNVYCHLARRLIGDVGRRWSWTADDSLLGPAGVSAAAPDASQLDHLRPGTRAHVASVLRLQTLFDVYDRMADGDMRYPLLSQPVMEACFSVPSWRWMSGGRNRALAREAFADQLPASVLQRKGKGRYDTLVVAAYDRSRSAMRDLLLGGWLASQKIIDVDAVAKALEAPASAASIAHSRPIRLVDAELWCRMVLDRQRITGAR